MTAALPTISVITPSYNQGCFIEENLISLQRQKYPRLEHIVIDGGSTDETAEVIERHRAHLAAYVSEKDDGQYDAINKGFDRASGEVLAWLNSDDLYLPGALQVVGEIFEKFPQIEWLTTRFPLAVGEDGRPIKVSSIYGFTREGFRLGENLPGFGWAATSYIQQESTFWRRSLWQRAGGKIDLRYRVAGDFALWATFFKHAELYAVDVPLGCFRRHCSQRTATVFMAYAKEAKAILAEIGARPRTGIVANARIWLRESLPTAWRAWVIRRGLIDAAPAVTYDWSREEWVLEQR